MIMFINIYVDGSIAASTWPGNSIFGNWFLQYTIETSVSFQSFPVPEQQLLKVRFGESSVFKNGELGGLGHKALRHG